MDPARVAVLHGLLDELVATGKYPALQVCVRRHGRVVLHRALGRFRPLAGGDWRPADRSTRFCLFSISKSVTATCLHLLFDRDRLRVDDPVAWYVPEFAQHGKDLVTLRHVLCHQAGIPMMFWHVTDELIRDWDAIVARICAQRPWHPPGRRTGYHLISGGYVLGEVLRRVDGRDLRTFLREEILDPMGFETFDYGIAPSWYEQTACSERVDALPPAPLLQGLSRVLDVDLEDALAVMNRPAVFEGVIPSGNVVGTAEETSRFFQMLLDGGVYEGRRIVGERQLQRARIEQEMARADWTLGLTPQRYSLGFMLGRKRTGLNVFGKGTERTFGHLGFMRNLGWADPDHGIAGGFLTSGKPIKPGRELLLLRRFQDTLRAACHR